MPRRGQSTNQMSPGKLCYGSTPLWRFLLPVAILLSFAQGLWAGEITTYSDDKGRCVYVNSEDQELTQAVSQGGVASALQVIERRKRQLPNIDSFIQQTAFSQQLDPNLVHAVIEVESGWNAKARSQKGAEGLMQLMPKTAARFGVHDSFDPRENITGGVKYLHYLFDRFGHKLNLTLAAYNAGEQIVAERDTIPPYKETLDYVQRIQALYAGSTDKRAESGLPKIDRTARGGTTVYTNLN